MELTSAKLVQDLLELTKKNLNAAEQLKLQLSESLNFKQTPESWSALECIEHLNRYGAFYIPEIENRIKSSRHKKSEVFKSNWIGKYFSKSVSYSKKMNKMKTFKSMNPNNSKLNTDVIDIFIQQQLKIIELLNLSRNINLDKTKTAISISKFIKIRLGDTFRVLIFHNERHLKQAEKSIKSIQI